MSIRLIQENISEHFNNLEKYFQTIFSSFGRFYINPEEIHLDNIFYLDIFFNETGEKSIYYSNTSFYNKELFYFGLDSNPLIKNNKLINFENYISPQLILSFNLDSSNESGIVFGLENNNIFLLSPIDFSALNDDDVSILKEMNKIELIGGQYFINFGKFDEGISLLRNIRNFLSHFHIDNTIFNYIKLLPKESVFSPEKIDSTDKNTIKKNNYCMFCGENIDDTYSLNQDIKKIAGENPNKCASCFSKILMSYFKSQIENRTNNKCYLISLANKPELVKFYLKLLETNGIIKRTFNIEFKEELSIYDRYFNDIPDEYLIEFEELNIKHENIIKNIDKLTLFEDDILDIDFEKSLVDKGLTLETGWIIRDELINLVISHDFKKESPKQIKKYIKKRIKELSRSHKPKKIFKHSQDLIKLTLNPNGKFNNAFIEKLNDNNLSIDEGKEIFREIKQEIEDGKLISVSLETRFNQLVKNKKHSTESIPINDV